MPIWEQREPAWMQKGPMEATWEGMQAGIALGTAYRRAAQEAMMAPLELERQKLMIVNDRYKAEGAMLGNEIARKTLEDERLDQLDAAEYLKANPTPESRITAPTFTPRTPKWMQWGINLERADGTSAWIKQQQSLKVDEQKAAAAKLKVDSQRTTSAEKFFKDVNKENLSPDDLDVLQDTYDEKGFPTSESRNMFATMIANRREVEKQHVEELAKDKGLEPVKVTATGTVTYGRPPKPYLTFADGSVLMKSGSDLVKVNLQTGDSETYYDSQATEQAKIRNLAKLTKEQQAYLPGSAEYKQWSELISQVKAGKAPAATKPAPKAEGEKPDIGAARQEAYDLIKSYPTKSSAIKKRFKETYNEDL